MIRRAFSDLLDNLLNEAIRFYGDRLITLAVFGSVGRGTPRPDSDVDLLLVVNPLPSGRMKRVQEFAAIEESLEDFLQALKAGGIDTCIAPVFKTPEEVAIGSPLFLDMIDDARILYDRDDFFQRFLQNLKDKLEHLGARRVKYRGAWFWDLKPGFKKGDVVDFWQT
ncbi:MAG: nucleotidyltransferase domain-containing protein [Firmicutes bacterium]|nr:nucleotidyltransferase domain-containing protein [Bacillota bacterium]